VSIVYHSVGVARCNCYWSSQGEAAGVSLDGS